MASKRRGGGAHGPDRSGNSLVSTWSVIFIEVWPPTALERLDELEVPEELEKLEVLEELDDPVAEVEKEELEAKFAEEFEEDELEAGNCLVSSRCRGGFGWERELALLASWRVALSARGSVRDFFEDKLGTFFSESVSPRVPEGGTREETLEG